MARRTSPKTTAADFLPATPEPTLSVLREAAEGCRGCGLYKNATQVVFGEGPREEGAEVMFVGEQPGDQEDRQGHPFVGPAGRLLDEALAEAGIDRSRVYVTNAVKHFKWTPAPSGKRRVHAKPSTTEVRACRPWLEREIGLVKPKIVVCLGSTAAQALLGSEFRVTRQRGEFFEETPWAPAVMATVHPSSILRAPDPAAREGAYRGFVADLKKVADAMTRPGGRGGARGR